MKPTLLVLPVLLAALSAEAQTLTVGAEAIPHAEILEQIRPVLAKEGIDLKVKVFTNGFQENFAVEQGELDANYFQHQPFLDYFNASKGTHLVSVVRVHVEPFGAYSQRIRSVAALKEGAVVAIPNDPSNTARALLLLEREGLIGLNAPSGGLVSVRDVVRNPKKLQIREIEAATLPRLLAQFDLALINTNYALQAGLKPTRDALFIEDARSPYANVVVARADKRSDPALQKLAAALTTPAVKQFIAQKYQGAVLPVF